jgi:alkanesulfonate monooxygenase SsuD/methylene tetrahydromethanopterin reductase-like flavin-dependent oxidoreductase (luciferase family)
MRFGISVPNFGDFGDTARLVETARIAENAGWDAVFVWDHMQFDSSVGPLVDPWVAMAAIALATDRVRIGPMVTPLPRRRPTKLARETVTLDHLCGGRLTLGVGIGWPPAADFGYLGDAADNKVRGAQLDEGLDVLIGLWSGEPFHHRGRYYTVIDARFLPRPVQEPRIPIWVAGMWPYPRPFRRGARWDGIVPLALGDDGEPRMASPREIRAAVEFTLDERSSDEPFDVAVPGDMPEGDLRDLLQEYEDAGATWWLESPPFPLHSYEAWLERVAAGPIP